MCVCMYVCMYVCVNVTGSCRNTIIERRFMIGDPSTRPPLATPPGDHLDGGPDEGPIDRQFFGVPAAPVQVMFVGECGVLVVVL